MNLLNLSRRQKVDKNLKELAENSAVKDDIKVSYKLKNVNQITRAEANVISLIC